MPEVSASTRLTPEEVRARLRTFLSAPIAGNTVLVAAPGAGFRLVLYGFTIHGQDTDADNTARFTTSGGTLLTQNFTLNQERHISVPPNAALTPIAVLPENETLELLVTGTTPAMTCQVWFVRERI